MIPIMRPLLPNAGMLLPYLARIDDSRWYSNFGPLVSEYEERLSARYNCHVVSCASATVGLTACLMAMVPAGSVVGMPSWTFAATASAIFAAGCRAHMCDVDTNNVMSVAATVGCCGVVPVMPLGQGLDLKWWKDWSTENRKVVVVDGASGFDALLGMDILLPVVVSTHCTKAFGTGEGGFILTSDKLLASELRKILNQGMKVDKSVARLGFNGKLSEYHAAVGLAELDGWSSKRERWAQVQEWYGESREWVTSTHDELVEGDVLGVIEKMERSQIQCRASWYGIAHKQAVYGDGKALPRTEMLAAQTIFLPKYVDMTLGEIERVREVLNVSKRKTS